MNDIDLAKPISLDNLFLNGSNVSIKPPLESLIKINSYAKDIVNSKLTITGLELRTLKHSGKKMIFATTGWKFNPCNYNHISGYMIIPEVFLLDKGYHTFAISDGDICIPLVHISLDSKKSSSTIFNEIKNYNFYIQPLYDYR